MEIIVFGLLGLISTFRLFGNEKMNYMVYDPKE